MSNHRIQTVRHDPLRKLIVTYVSIVIIILVTITAKEFLVSFAIAQERTSQAIAQTIGRQRSRVLLFLLDTVELNQHIGNRAAELADIKANDQTWEAVQAAALNPAGSPVLDLPWWQSGFPSAIIAEIKGSTGNYLAIRAAVQRIETSSPGEPLTPELAVLAQRVPAYQATFLQVYNGLVAVADNQVQQVAHVELFLYVLTILCVLSEVLLVIRPVIRDLQALIRNMARYIQEAHTAVPPTV